MSIMAGILAGGQGIAQGINALGSQWKDEREKAAFLDLLNRSGLGGGQPQTLASLTQPMQTNPIPGPQPVPVPQTAAPAPVSEDQRISQGFASEFGNKWAASPGAIGGAVPAMAGVPVQVPGQPQQRMAYAPGGAATASNIPAGLIRRESDGNWAARNNVPGAGGLPGHFGRLQFGQARLQEAAAAGAIPQGTTPQQFMQSPELQQRAEAWHFADIDSFIQRNGLDRAVGQTISGVPITLDGMRSVAHLGGKDGLRKFIETGGQYNPADANGTSLMSYLALGARGAGSNRLGNVQPMQGGGAPQPPQPTPGMPQQPMTLAGLTAAPQQPQMSLGMLGELATNKYGAPIAAMLMQQRFGRDPIQQQLAQVQLEGARLNNENTRRTMAGEGSKLTYQDLGDSIAAINGRGEIVKTIPKGQKPVTLSEGQTLVNPQTGQPIGPASTVAPKLTETQSKDLSFYQRGAGAENILRNFEGSLTSAGNAALGSVPGVGNFLTSKDYQQAQQAGREVLAAILRKDTGAAVTQSEMELYGSMFLPKPGDAPAVVQQKREARQRALEAIKLGLGKAEVLATTRIGPNAGGTQGQRKTSTGVTWSVQ